MKNIIPLIIIAALCLGASPRLKSPKEQGEMLNEPMLKVAPVVRAPPVEQVILSWSYPLSMPQPGLVFDVEHRENLRSGSWAKVGETTAPPFSYATGKKSGFFRITARATNTATNTVTLAWTWPGDNSIVGYQIHRGPSSRNYTNSIAVGNSLSATVSNVTSKTFFAATAWSGDGLQSSYSNEVSYEPGTNTVYTVTGLTITKL